MPSSRATARSDSPAAPSVARWRRAAATISRVSSARTRARAPAADTWAVWHECESGGNECEHCSGTPDRVRGRSGYRSTVSEQSTPFWGPDFDALQHQDPEIAGVVLDELDRLRGGLQLIASENLTSPAV